MNIKTNYFLKSIFANQLADPLPSIPTCAAWHPAEYNSLSFYTP